MTGPRTIERNGYGGSPMCAGPALAVRRPIRRRPRSGMCRSGSRSFQEGCGSGAGELAAAVLPLPRGAGGTLSSQFIMKIHRTFTPDSPTL